jgi:hypothetical protein
MFKTGLALGFVAGYVLGAKAGRERYQQMVDAAKAFNDNPSVQRFTNEVSKTVNIGKERAADAAARAGDQLSQATGRASGQGTEPAATNGRDAT